MAKIHPAVGTFLGAARDLDIFDEALALITKDKKPASKSKGKMSAATKAKIAKKLKASWAAKRKKAE